GLYGGTLEKAYNQEIFLADLEPRLKFTDQQGFYLVRGGQENIGIEGVNVEKANLEIHEVYKNNLLFFFYDNYDYYNQYSPSNGSRYGNNYYVRYFGKRLHEEELTFESVKNVPQRQTINLDHVLESRFKGVYMVSVRSDQDYWLKDAKLVAVSNIGLIAKYTSGQLMVFANSLSTAEPMAGVEVKLISSNNQTLIKGTTDANGIAKFEDIQSQVEGFTPVLLTAEKGDDFNFLDMRSTQVETSRYEVGGKYVNPESYDAFIYADRNIYRPGEQVHLSAILRDADMGVPAGVPVSMKLINPRGQTVEKFQQELNEQGSFETEFNVPDFAQTGQYVAELYTGDDKYLNSYRFNVEEFVPDKIRVNATADQEEVQSGGSVSFDIASEYLFGAPAANHRYEVDISLSHRSFSSKKYPEFQFYNTSTRQTSLSNAYSDGDLDDNGKARVSYQLPTGIKTGGYLQGRAVVSVFDLTGRTVNRFVPFKAYPRNSFIGLRSEGYYYQGVNDDISYQFIAVDRNDKPISNFSAEVQLIRKEWRTVLEKVGNSGQYRYRSVKKEVKEWKKPVTITGKPTPFTFKVDQSGQYELRVYQKGRNDYISHSFYAYYYGRAKASSFEIDKEGRVEIILDKEKYAPGEKAKVLFVTPFTGKMLVTVERDKVLEHQFLEVSSNSTELTLNLDSKHLPNAYITATLFRPHSEDQGGPFLVGHGFKPIMVEAPSNKLEVTIQAPENRVKPRTRQMITVKTAPEQDVFVTLAAVDEGILQVKNFKSPDPYAHMYAKRGLGVSSYDLYEYLLPEMVASRKSSVAGGDEMAAGRRLNPVKAKRFKLLAKWSGIRKTNSKGEITVPLDLPQYNGEVRLMAVAYKNGRFGSAEKALKVADDIVLQPSIPRSLSIGDSLLMPISVMNTSGKSGSVKVNVKVSGPLKLGSGSSESVKLTGNGTGNTQFVVKAKDQIGVGKITITTSGLDEVKEEIEIGVRPVSPLVVNSNGGSISGGKTQNIPMPRGFLEGTQTTSLTVSAFPGVQHAKQLRYLLGYPHGCVEQTTSKLFPQLYFNDMAALVAPDMYKDGNPVYFIKEGITKLQSMQRYDGSFSYWMGGSYVNWWGSIYATHFLLEAKKAGYEVNQSILDKALTYLLRKAADRDTYEYYYYVNGNYRSKRIAKKEVLYSLYVLALAGKEEVSFMNFYRARPQLLTADSRYLLAGAFALAKNYTAFNEIIPRAFDSEKAQRTTGGSFDSDMRANALMLNVLMDVDPNNSQIPGLVKYLSSNMGRLYSTQERSWTFLALGKVAKRTAASNLKIEVMSDGKKVTTLDGKNDRYVFPNNPGQITLKASGTGETFFYWNTEGIKADGKVEEVDNNLRVRREYLNRNGGSITDGEFQRGDLIVCRITLSNGPRRAENVAITDMVPSGFEIENPRLTPSAELGWIKNDPNKLSYDHMDVRDDRIILYTTAYSGTSRSFYYLLRVVNAGTFPLPPIGAEAMYDPDFRSYHGAGVVKVIP
ncbi:MAG: alpha-2-macroglobulin, partial [Bacteroidota bacterium]